jgi:hypothetical protein
MDIGDIPDVEGDNVRGEAETVFNGVPLAPPPLPL